MSSATRHQHYDVVIIGGGMVGLCLAAILEQKLHQTPARILLLESSRLESGKARQPGFDARSTVLSYGTVRILKQFKLWQPLENFASAITRIHVSDQGQFGQSRIDAKSEQVPALGYVLENQDIGKGLNAVVLQSTTIESCSPVQVRAIHHEQNQARLDCESASEKFSVSAALVVLAEGGRSGLSESLGITRQHSSYGQSGIITNIAFSEAHQGRAFERFTRHGPLAVLPLKNFDQLHRGALIWTQKTEAVDEVMALSDEAFLRRLQNEFGQRLGQFTRVGERVCYPFSLQQTTEQIRHNLVLLGNSAHTLHPVAGQGFNLALRDTLCLAENISESIKQGDNPGEFARLQAYLQTVEADQQSTITFSHYLTRLFSSENRLVSHSRQLALLGLDLLPPAKRLLSTQAMGLGNVAAETGLR